MKRMPFQRFILLICAAVMIVLAASCSNQPPHSSEIVPPVSAPLPSESPSSAQTVPLVLVGNTAVQPWGIAVTNEEKSISIPLMSQDFTSILGSNYSSSSVLGNTVIYHYSDLGLFLTTDSYGYLIRINIENTSDGWKLNGQIGPGDSEEDLTNLFGSGKVSDFSDSEVRYYFSRTGEQLSSSDLADVVVSFDISDGIIQKLNVLTLYLLPPPAYVAEEVCTIYDPVTSAPNSAGGVDFEVSFTNSSEKTIKYITFYVTPYNAVSDPVASEIGGTVQAVLKGTGPFPTSPRGREGLYELTWENVWYNKTIRLGQIDAVDIEYMDGSLISLTAQDS